MLQVTGVTHTFSIFFINEIESIPVNVDKNVKQAFVCIT
jgi:hypothetical protein